MTIIIALVWLTATTLQIGLGCACYRGRVHQRHPAFAAFIYFQNFICILAGCIFHAAPGTYFWAYHISFGLTSALTLLVAMECGKLTFGPRMALPIWVPASYSRRLGISGQPHTHKIMAGFVLYLSVNVLAVFIRGSARPGVAVVAVALGMGAYCISLIYWTVALWIKEEDPERLTLQQTNDLTTTLRLLHEKAKSLGAVTTH